MYRARIKVGRPGIKTFVMIRNHQSPDQVDGSGHKEKWTDMRYILVIESVILVNQMGARRERKGRNSKIMLRFFLLEYRDLWWF